MFSERTAKRGEDAFPCVLHLGRRERKRRGRGQATIEYVLMLGVSAVIGLAFLSTFNKILQQGIVIMNAALEQNLVTAGYPESGAPGGSSMWEN